ncbi:TetR/AcrR family transcriptional regulator [Flexithrix dorotheae]|uniref:TetR/AcrR family transcriptional regulator n=1 Tax=Flexithrix dorotheae TaxID=70993 RepID=UPI000376A7A3|nr:TetR/AcrR family transcriptional regulator [Flexithrix dorotheae]
MSPRTEEQFASMREKSKELLMDTALQLFSKKGFHSTSISQITNEAGVAKGILYHYFKSKEELLVAIIQKGTNELQSLFLEAFKAENPREQLEQMIRVTVKAMKEQKLYWQLFSSLITQMHDNKIIEDILKPLTQQSIILMEGLFSKLGKKNPKMEAIAIAALFDGIGLHYLFVMDDYPIDEITEFIIEKILGNQSDTK